MKNLLSTAFLLLFAISTFAQKNNIEQEVINIVAEKNEDKKLELIVDEYTTEFNNNPDLVIEIGLYLLKESQDKDDVVGEASAYCMLGHGYRLSGNNIKGLEFHHKALTLAEKTKNLSLLAMVENQMAHIYKDRDENDKAINLYLTALKHSEQGSNERVRNWPLLNLGAVYLSIDKLDSSLMFSQRAYSTSLRLNDKTALGYILSNLGGVQSKLGNAQLAISYYQLAIQELRDSSMVRHLSLTYTGLAEHFQRNNELDSCEFYAKKAIALIKNTVFFYLSGKPASLLMGIYEFKNCDSTLKYAKIYKAANDSLYNRKTSQQIQLMTFDEDLRQQELAAKKILEEEHRIQNLQYASIVIGIFTFFILFALLSRSVMVNENVISFMGILGLLMVFEFINLLLHPFLEKVTNHSPILMLLSLVAIASLLIPFHHKLEKLIKERMTEKNKERRLAAAKKTIEELENAKNNKQN